MLKKKKEKCKLTILTPTYNRGWCLSRVYDCLKNQTNHNFIWLIVDDGSTDNTKDLVANFIKDCKLFKIKYLYKENGGKHTALNLGFKNCETVWVMDLDSDDEYVKNSVELVYKNINFVEKLRNKKIWRISGRSIDFDTKEMVGPLFDLKINNFSGRKQLKYSYKNTFEKIDVRKTNILRKYPFPVYHETKFVTENTVWELINRKYDSYFTNDVFRIYHQDSPDSLDKGKVHNESKDYTWWYYSLFCVNVLFDEFFFNKNVRICFINIARKSMLLKIKYSDVMKKINKWYKKVLITLFSYPVAWLYLKIKHEG